MNIEVGSYVRDKRSQDSRVHFRVNEIDTEKGEYHCSSVGFQNQIKIVRKLHYLELVIDTQVVNSLEGEQVAREAAIIEELQNFNPRKGKQPPRRHLKKRPEGKITGASTPEQRLKALMPEGVPRYIRCYDNHGATADRYTICFTGRYRFKTGGEFYFITMDSKPTHPQGVCMTGSSKERIDYPSYQHLGSKITFAELPEDCREIVIERYVDLWDITAHKAYETA